MVSKSTLLQCLITFYLNNLPPTYNHYEIKMKATKDFGFCTKIFPLKKGNTY